MIKEFQLNRLVDFHNSLTTRGYGYGFGDKLYWDQHLRLWINPNHLVDCSGYVRAALIASCAVDIGDGSVQQHANVNDWGYLKGKPADGHKIDGALRIAFLAPYDTSERIGHVMLIHNSMTFESHGHHGPDRRSWGCEPFMGLCSVFQLSKVPAAPTDTAGSGAAS